MTWSIRVSGEAMPELLVNLNEALAEDQHCPIKAQVRKAAERLLASAPVDRAVTVESTGHLDEGYAGFAYVRITLGAPVEVITAADVGDVPAELLN